MLYCTMLALRDQCNIWDHLNNRLLLTKHITVNQADIIYKYRYKIYNVIEIELKLLGTIGNKLEYNMVYPALIGESLIDEVT